ncbi:MAG: colanic acid biosynthesis glycosyltransferase WcaL, partial [Verrucomicrobiaceae bacterium]|nr:colanic acid biosynthesis glycosyltransferase WcaL [Verrucomicrobiaceae bacterium]
DVIICSIHPPRDGLRHPRLNNLRAPILYAPPPEERKGIENDLIAKRKWPKKFLADHARVYGEETRPELSCRNAAHFAELLPRLGVDHVHMHFANRATHAALMLKELQGIPFSFTPQAQDFLIDISSPELLGEMCRQAEFVVVACDWARDELLKLVPAVGGKVRRIYNGIDPAPYPRAQPAPDGKTLKIASVGRLIEFKGFHHLIAAIAKVRDRGVTVKLDLMGDGPWRERLENQVKNTGLESQVVFHGSVKIDQMRECYARVDAFALACIEDTKGAMDVFPTVITEAMLSSLPVLSCRIAGVPEQVIDGETGFVTEPADEEALAGALYRLATEPGLAAKMGEAGRQRAMDFFAIDKTLPMLEAEFERLPAKRSAPGPAKVGALYDLASPGSGALLELERGTLREQHAQIWLAGGTLTRKEADRFAPATSGGFWVPDGMALEAEWMARPEERERLGALRVELAELVNAEDFFDAARRALWIASQSKRLGLPKVWYAPTEAEALVVWLLHVLTERPFAVAGDADSAMVVHLAKKAVVSALASSETNALLRPRPCTNESPRGFLRKVAVVQDWRKGRRQGAFKNWLRKVLK